MADSVKNTVQPDRRVGSRTGAYAAALGHAMLAWQPLERTLTDLDELSVRLLDVRATGYAVSDGKNAVWLRTVAAPVLWPDGTARATVSLTVRTTRQDLAAFIDTAVPPLLQAAQALTGAVRRADAA